MNAEIQSVSAFGDGSSFGVARGDGAGAPLARATPKVRTRPPISDTGVDDTNRPLPQSPVVGFHDLEGVFQTMSPERVARILLATVGILVRDQVALEAFDYRGSGAAGYKRLLHGPYGITMKYSPGRPDIHVVIPGQACDVAGFNRLFGLFRFKKFRCSRFDWAFDVSSDEVPTVVEISNMFMDEPNRIRTHVAYEGDSRRFNRSLSGSTAYLGSPSSDTQLRVYDRRGFHRFEMQIRGYTARLLQGWMQSDRGAWIRFWSWETKEKFVAAMFGFLRSFVDFIDEGDDSNKARADLQPWWQDLVGHFDKYRISRPVHEKTLQQVVNYISKQVAPTLAALSHFPQFTDWFDGWIKSGIQRMKGNRKLLLIEAQSDWQKILAPS